MRQKQDNEPKPQSNIMKNRIAAWLTSRSTAPNSAPTEQPNVPTPPADELCFSHRTLEALPRLENYTNEGFQRPSLGELHGSLYTQNQPDHRPVETESVEAENGVKLGWIQGVLVPCLLNIWGIMLFLRLPWVVAQAGVGESLLIIAISAVVCVLTTLSMSAICTNGEMKGGGFYYIISRSLGPEFGASIGVIFAFSNAVAVSMNTVGFCDTLNNLLANYGLRIVDGGYNDTRIVGVVVILITVFMCAVGIEWGSKMQVLLLLVILGAIVDFLVGVAIGPQSDEQLVRGFENYNLNLLNENWYSRYSIDQTFFSVFAIFFPLVTGIQAGTNISGDLKDPGNSIPKGTLAALVISMLAYAIFAICLGGVVHRDASGVLTELFNNTFLNCGSNCEFGMANRYTILGLVSVWAPLIYAGCFAATLSTALTNLLSVPRLIRALGMDGIYPGLQFFSKRYGKSGEPYRGYILTYIVSAGFLLIAELNVLAPLISNFYLASYSLVNFCTFHASLVKPLGWRPTFKYYNMWLSLLGFISCLVIMFLIDWTLALITFAVIIALYLIVVYRKPDVNWGSTTQAQTYKTALASAYRLSRVVDHVKNYRPQILVLCGVPQHRPTLVALANLIAKGHALIVCGNVCKECLSHKDKTTIVSNSNVWLQQRRFKAFFSHVDGLSFEAGCRVLMQCSGIGKLVPNVVMIGFKQDWQKCSREDLLQYFNILHNAFDNRLALTILRLKDGLDYSQITDDNLSSEPTLTAVSYDSGVSGSYLQDRYMVESESSLPPQGISSYLPTDSFTQNVEFRKNVPSASNSPAYFLRSRFKDNIAEAQKNKQQLKKQAPRQILSSLTVFDRKHASGTLDVWWLYDDGGLTILLPYIISTRHNWANCKLRIFALSMDRNDPEVEYKNIKSLLKKIRIQYESLTLVRGISDNPKPETVAMFQELLTPLTNISSTQSVTDEQMSEQAKKTHHHLRVREMLLEHSSKATLIVMSLPMPRQNKISAELYMAWLDILSKDMPPFFFVRGNHTSVLTFYT